MIARLLPAVALLISVGSPAWAQTQAPEPTAPAPAAPAPVAPAPAPSAPVTATPATSPPAMSKATQAEVEHRIKTLQTALGITEAQMPLWQTFAQSMRDSAAATEALFERRARAASTMSAVDNMRSYAEIARAYAETMERLANDFASLYASLSDLQRRAADTMFRKQSVAATQGKPP
jgi:LTXXQ motif family protein